MPNYSLAEIYFIAAMMILITAGSFFAVFIFFRTYKIEKAQNQTEKEKKSKQEIEQKKQQKEERKKEYAEK